MKPPCTSVCWTSLVLGVNPDFAIQSATWPCRNPPRTLRFEEYICKTCIPCRGVESIDGREVLCVKYRHGYPMDASTEEARAPPLSPVTPEEAPFFSQVTQTSPIPPETFSCHCAEAHPGRKLLHVLALLIRDGVVGSMASTGPAACSCDARIRQLQ